MKLIVIITLIALILIIAAPVSSESHSVTQGMAIPLITGGYNIGEINSSACDYALTWEGANTFNVKAADYYNESGVSISSQSGNYNLSLCWKPYSVYSLSGSEITSSHDGLSFSLGFGVGDSMFLYQNLTTRVNLVHFRYSTHISLGIFWIGEVPYVTVTNASGEFMYHPSLLSAHLSGSTTTITGKYYDLNVSLHNATAQGYICRINSKGKFSSLYQVSTGGISFDPNTMSRPVYDKDLSVFVMPSEGGSIYSLNPWTHRIEKLLSFNHTISYVFSSGSNIYMVSSRSSGVDIIRIDDRSLNSTVSHYNITGHYFISSYHGYLHIFSPDLIQNLSSGKLTDISFRQYSQNGMFFEESSLDSLEYFIYCNNTMHVFRITSGRAIDVMNYTGIQEIREEGYGMDGPEVEIGFNYSSMYLLASGRSVAFHQSMMSEEDVYMEKNTSGAVLINGTDYTSLPLSLLGFSGNLTHGIAWNSDAFYLYGKFVEREGLNVTWHNDTIRHSGFLNFTIRSNTSYSASMNISGITDKINDSGSFYLNLTALPTGRYEFTVDVENSGGLLFAGNGFLDVDNSIPRESFNRSISSGVYNGESLLLSVNDTAGIRGIKLDLPGYTFSTNESSISFKIPSYSTKKSIGISITVTDGFNYSTESLFNASYYTEAVGSIAINIHNLEMINHRIFNITISGRIWNMSYFQVWMTNLSSSSSHLWNTTGRLELDLHDGNYSYEVSVKFITGNSLEVSSGVIDVNSRKPVVNISGLEERYYSRLRDSTNRSFNITLRSTMSGEWNVRITGPDQEWVELSSRNTTFTISSGMISSFTTSTGMYNVSGKFTSFNNFTEQCSDSFYMNNSLPEIHNGYTFYTNRSMANITGMHILPAGYNISLEYGNTMLENGTFEMAMQGNYTVNATIRNSAMAFETDKIIIIYSSDAPPVRIPGFNGTVDDGREVNLTIESSWIPVSRISVSTGLNYSINSSILTLEFNRDGLFNFTVGILNLCGDFNNRTYQVNVLSFPSIKGITVQYDQSFRFLSGEAYVEGYNLGSVQYTWLDNGVVISRGRCANFTLDQGSNHLSVLVISTAGSDYRNFTLFAVGAKMVAAAASSGIVILAYIFVPLKFNQVEIGNIILQNDGITVRRLVRILRKKHFSRKRFVLVLERMQKGGMIRLGKDLNGDDCIKVMKLKKK